MNCPETKTDVARERIEHIVVLMLENRSFDHLFGFLEHPKLVKLESGDHENPLDPEDPDSKCYGVTPDAWYALPVDPPHSHVSVMKQLHGTGPSRMDGFVAAYLEKANGKEAVPVIHWGRIRWLVVVVAALLVLLARWLGPRWWTAMALSLVVAAVTTVKLWRLRHVLPHWLRYLTIGLGASAALGALAFTFGDRWSTAIGMGVLLAISGLLIVQCASSRPLYVHPRDPQQALDDAPEIMRCMPDRMIPALGMLARGFAVCSAWHCSVPGATWPNRNFAHAATSDGTTDIEIGLYHDRTIFDLLSSAGASWHIYHDGIAQVMAFEKVWKGKGDHWFDVSFFEKHVAAGTLPKYSFIEPCHDGPTSNSQHPANNLGPHSDRVYDFQRGEALIAHVYETLKRHEDIFRTTLFLITYDEHGGLFDHISPPTGVPPPRKKIAVDLVRRLIALFVTYVGSQFSFNILGPRVPAVVVSPWIDPGFVDGTQYEHSSIAATVRTMFAPDAKPLNKREAAACTFEGMVTFRTEARDIETLPDLTGALTPRPPALTPPPGVLRARAGRLGTAGLEKTDLAEQLDRLAAKVDKRLAKAGAADVAAEEVTPAALGGEIRPNERVVARFRRYCERERERERRTP